jgi:RNA polymerase sigma-70 factor (ECF subfamily)
LRECLQQLPDSQRQTILLRYYEDDDIAKIAAKTKRTEGAVYRLLSRIRTALNECISARLASQT